jgi:hypothetical protein
VYTGIKAVGVNINIRQFLTKDCSDGCLPSKQNFPLLHVCTRFKHFPDKNWREFTFTPKGLNPVHTRKFLPFFVWVGCVCKISQIVYRVE